MLDEKDASICSLDLLSTLLREIEVFTIKDDIPNHSRPTQAGACGHLLTH